MYRISSSSVNPVTFIFRIQMFFIIDSTAIIVHTSIISCLQYCSRFKLAHLSPFLLLYNLYSIHSQRDLLKMDVCSHSPAQNAPVTSHFICKKTRNLHGWGTASQPVWLDQNKQEREMGNKVRDQRESMNVEGDPEKHGCRAKTGLGLWNILQWTELPLTKQLCTAAPQLEFGLTIVQLKELEPFILLFLNYRNQCFLQ